MFLAKKTPYTLTQADKDKLVSSINEVRKNYYGKDTTLLVKWSDTIATRAATVANKCENEHSTPADRQYGTDEYGNPQSYGENLAANGGIPGQSFPFATWSEQVALWKNEEDSWNCADNSCKDVCGHLTQLIWKDTNEIGCAVARCPGGVSIFATGTEFQYLVCQFKQGGNVMNFNPLKGFSWDLYFNDPKPNVYDKCPVAAYTRTGAIPAINSEVSQEATQESHGADGITVPMGAFVAVAVVCGLIVFLVILVVIAFIVVINKKNEMKSESLL